MGKSRSQIEITPEKLAMVDPWYWAYWNEIDLGSAKFTLKGHEYQVEPMQDPHRRKCARKATQMGWSEAFILTVLHGLSYGVFPEAAIYLFPTLNTVTDFSATRFNPLIQSNPCIAQFVRDLNRVDLKRVGKGKLYFRSGRLSQMIADGQMKSSAGLKGIPADVVVFDEVDEMDPGAIPLAIGRMQHSRVKGEIYLGNPTRPDYGIDLVYQKSDQRSWFLRCGSCNEWTCFEEEFPECLRRQKDGSVIRICKKCERELKPGTGEWVAAVKENSDYMHGWSISHLNSVYKDPKEILDEWESPTLDKQSFYNLTLGLPYIGAESRLTVPMVLDCCSMDAMEGHSRIPTAMGVDVGKVLNVVIGHRVSDTFYKILKVARVSSFYDIHDLCKRFNVRTAVFDLYPETRKVRDFGRASSFQVYGCDYREHQKGSYAWNEVDDVVSVNRTEVCDATHELVMEKRLELPRVNDEIKVYAKQMTMIAKILKTDELTGEKKYLYQRIGDKQDHYRHATNYFFLAAQRMNPSRIVWGRGARREVKSVSALGWT